MYSARPPFSRQKAGTQEKKNVEKKDAEKFFEELASIDDSFLRLTYRRPRERGRREESILGRTSFLPKSLRGQLEGGEGDKETEFFEQPSGNEYPTEQKKEIFLRASSK